MDGTEQIGCSVLSRDAVQYSLAPFPQGDRYGAGDRRNQQNGDRREK